MIWKDKAGEMKELTVWHNCQVWNKLADIVHKYVGKGSLIAIDGASKNYRYENNGLIKYWHYIDVRLVKFIKTVSPSDAQVSDAQVSDAQVSRAGVPGPGSGVPGPDVPGPGVPGPGPGASASNNGRGSWFGRR